MHAFRRHSRSRSDTIYTINAVAKSPSSAPFKTLSTLVKRIIGRSEDSESRGGADGDRHKVMKHTIFTSSLVWTDDQNTSNSSGWNSPATPTSLDFEDTSGVDVNQASRDDRSCFFDNPAPFAEKNRSAIPATEDKGNVQPPHADSSPQRESRFFIPSSPSASSTGSSDEYEWNVEYSREYLTRAINAKELGLAYSSLTTPSLSQSAASLTSGLSPSQSLPDLPLSSVTRSPGVARGAGLETIAEED